MVRFHIPLSNDTSPILLICTIIHTSENMDIQDTYTNSKMSI